MPNYQKRWQAIQKCYNVILINMLAYICSCRHLIPCFELSSAYTFITRQGRLPRGCRFRAFSCEHFLLVSLVTDHTQTYITPVSCAIRLCLRMPMLTTVTAALTILFLESAGSRRLLSLNRRLQGHELLVLRPNINPDITGASSAVLLRYHLSCGLSALSCPLTPSQALPQLVSVLPD